MHDAERKRHQGEVACSASSLSLVVLSVIRRTDRLHDQALGVGVPVSKVCSSLPGLKRTAFPGVMLTSVPVRGLRPIPVLRARTLNTPKPRNSMRSPLVSERRMLSNTVSTANSALVLVIPVLFTTSLIMSSLITGGSRRRTENNLPSH